MTLSAFVHLEQNDKCTKVKSTYKDNIWPKLVHQLLRFLFNKKCIKDCSKNGFMHFLACTFLGISKY